TICSVRPLAEQSFPRPRLRLRATGRKAGRRVQTGRGGRRFSSYGAVRVRSSAVQCGAVRVRGGLCAEGALRRGGPAQGPLWRGGAVQSCLGGVVVWVRSGLGGSAHGVLLGRPLPGPRC